MNHQALFPDHVRHALQFEPPGAWMPKLPEGTIRLSAGYPSPKVVPFTDITSAVSELVQAERDLPFHYLGSPSMEKLAELVKNRLRQRGMGAEGDELLITSGGCQAIDLVARALLDDESVVIVESPTYMEALEIFRNYTNHIHAVPVDAEGLRVDLLEEWLHAQQGKQPVPKLVYTIPSFQNPTGTTLSPNRRRSLIELSKAYGFVIVEDDAYGELAFENVPSTIKSMDGGHDVVHIGSLSKVVSPGLRIGWALGPKSIIQAMDVFKKDLSHPFSEATAAHYLSSIDFAQRIDSLRAFYQQQWISMEDALNNHMPDSVSWIRPQGGYFVWLTIPGVDTSDMLRDAILSGVAYVPGKYFYTHPSDGRHQLRLSFSYLDPNVLCEGVQRLADVIKHASTR